MAGAGVCLLYAVTPAAEPLKDIMLVVVSASSVGAMIIGLRNLGGRRPLAWILFTAGQASFLIGNAIWLVYRDVAHAEVPFPSVGDVFFLGAYPFFTAALVVLIRSGRRNRALLTDAAIIVLGAGALFLVFLIDPSLGKTGDPLLVRVTSVAYPSLDLVLLAVVIRLLIGRGAPTPAARLTAASFGVLLAADVAYGLTLLRGVYHIGGAIDAGWMLSYVLMGAAALDPSVRDAFPRVEPREWVSRGRMVFLAGSSLLAPASILLAWFGGGRGDVPLLAGLSGLLFLLVLARMNTVLSDLQRAQQARLRLAAIVESSTDAIIGKTLEGVITSWNAGAQRMYGYTAEEAVGRSVSMLLPPGEQDSLTDILHRVRKGEQVDSYETVRMRKDGGRIDVSLTISPTRDEAGRIVGASAIARDITDSRKARDEIRRSVERFAGLHEIDQAILATRSMRELATAALHHLRGLVGADRASILLFDQAQGAVTYLAVDPDDAIAPRAGDIVPLGDLPPVETYRVSDVTIHEDLRTMEPMTAAAERAVAQGLRSALSATLAADGEFVGLLSLASTRVGGIDPADREVVREVADQLAIALRHAGMKEELEQHAQDLEQALAKVRAAHLERKFLLTRVVAAQEEERHRIASDIHDDPVQQMTAVSLRLGSLERRHPELAETKEFKTLVDTVGGAIERLRGMMFDLRPYVLDRDGLGPALRLYLETRVAPGGDLVCRFDNRLTAEPPAETRVMLYRIAQEALTNVRRHAAASSVEVVLDGSDGGFGLTVRDDGTGFATDGESRSLDGHLGLSGMRERAESEGGWLRVESTPGAGTTVRAWIPGPETDTEDTDAAEAAEAAEPA
jgi:PAS domain S-box-containing protein